MAAASQERLKIALELRKMKPSELSNLTGISKQRISQYLNGGYEFKQSGADKMARALNVSPAWLIGFDVPMERAVQQNNNVVITNNSQSNINVSQEQSPLQKTMIDIFSELNIVNQSKAISYLDDLRKEQKNEEKQR